MLTEEIDRKALGKLVFSDQSKRQFLEALLHPEIRQTMHDMVEIHADIYGILEVPLLIEGEQHKRMDRVLVVTCPKHIRIQRLVENRGMSPDMIEKVMASQLSDEHRERHADETICNDQPISALESQVKAIHEKYLSLFG